MAQNALQKLVEAVHAAAINTKDAVVDGARAISNSPGAAPLHAIVRQGADEIAQILPAFPDSVKSVPESGQLLEPTQALVTKEITGRHLNFDMDR
ncbi:MAG TPA: hypothetical protein VK395_04165 [Gemmataceae bacterium]|nr:hypothetical protein [Gemmataceae bacterium]